LRKKIFAKSLNGYYPVCVIPEKLTLLPFKLDPKLLDAVDQTRGVRSRSHFIREALVKALRDAGVEISDSMIYPPDRAGVGGPKPKTANEAVIHERGIPRNLSYGEGMHLNESELAEHTVQPTPQILIKTSYIDKKITRKTAKKRTPKP